MTNEQQHKLFDLFDTLSIAYTTYEHAPAFTVDQAKDITAHVPGADTKNLFLKDDKKRIWLISACADTVISLKEVAKLLAAKGLRFAQEELLDEYLGVKPGSVSIFALINDTNHLVNVVLDSRLFDYELVGFHPLSNDATTVIASENLKKFVQECGNSCRILDFENMCEK